MIDNLLLIDNKFVLGSRSSVVDSRRNWEDRVFVGQLDRPDGSKILVGLVADGVGSADGSRGAQLAYDKALEYLQTGVDQTIPLLIKNAIEYANKAVFLENQTNNTNGLTTMVMAVISDDKLYVGNVGDSRAYWVQNPTANNKSGKMLQLTRDHSYYNIYGGDPNEEQANVLVNSIGNDEKVQVDLGFYLKGPDVEKAYQLGLNGLPLKPGDTVLLCSDGLIKTHPQTNIRYVSDDEIIDAIATEFETDKAVIKMISRAEGRKPDDNITAATIQFLSPETIKQAKARTASAQRMRQIRTGLIALGGVMALAVIAILVINLSRTSARMNKLANQPTSTPVFITSTPLPTLIPISIGQAIVDRVSGTGANVAVGQYINTGASVTSGNGLVRIRVGEITGRDGFLYLFPDSSAMVNFSDQMKPQLISGALYIQPGSSLATVDLGAFLSGLTASVSGSRMVVQVVGDEIWIFCFEGKCLLEPIDSNPLRIPEGSKMVFRISSKQADDPEKMSYSEQMKWNQECEYLCMGDFLPTPTPILYTKTPDILVTPTPKQGVYDWCPNLPNSQDKVPDGYLLVDGKCVVDVCSNIDGPQSVAPPGTIIVAGACLVDTCSNIDGAQATPPPGTIVIGGACFVDVCPNIPDAQPTIPDGYELDQNGDCKKIKDFCPNIGGNQPSIPDGMVLDGSGNCVFPTPSDTPPPPTETTEVPTETTEAPVITTESPTGG